MGLKESNQTNKNKANIEDAEMGAKKKIYLALNCNYFLPHQFRNVWVLGAQKNRPIETSHELLTPNQSIDAISLLQ